MRPRFLHAASFLSLFVLLALPLYAAGTKLGTPGPEDAPQLVTPGPDPVIRIPAAHQHAASGCIGYLYFSRKTIRYEVAHPDRDKEHSFEEPVANLIVARQWVFLMSGMPEAEFKFRDGRVFHFFRVKKKLIDATNEKLGWDDILPWELLVDAATKFDTVAAQVQAANAQSVAAATPAAPAAPPVDDSTAMDSAGLEVPPPPPWGRPAPTGGTGSGRP
jgi:hypothetical protein